MKPTGAIAAGWVLELATLMTATTIENDYRSEAVGAVLLNRPP
jgi:hypothetical protein